MKIIFYIMMTVEMMAVLGLMDVHQGAQGVLD